MTYKLKAPTRDQLEEAIPFELYREDEQGDKHLINCTKRYSYVPLPPKIKTEGEYNEDGDMTAPPTYHDYFLADLKVAEEYPIITFPEEVEVLEDIETADHEWA